MATAAASQAKDVLDLQGRLRRAVESLSPPARPAPRNLPYQQSPGALALVLTFWADGFVRDLERLGSLLAAARQAETLEVATLPLEEAFWRVDAACEKLRSLVFCGLGEPRAVIAAEAGFDRKEATRLQKKALRRLETLAKSDVQAAELLRHYRDLRPALVYRDQVAHTLSAIRQTFVMPVESVYFGEDLEVSRVRHHLHAPCYTGVDGTPQGRLQHALKVAEAAAVSLVEAGGAAAEVLKRHGVLGPFPTVFHVNGRAQWDDPRDVSGSNES